MSDRGGDDNGGYIRVLKAGCSLLFSWADTCAIMVLRGEKKVEKSRVVGCRSSSVEGWAFDWAHNT